MAFFAITLMTAILAIMVLVLLAIVLAAVGQSFGLRKFYVNVLLKVFEFGRVKINIHNNRQLEVEDVSSSDSDSDNNSDSCDTNANRNGGDFHRKLIDRQTKTHTRRKPAVRSLESMQSDFRLDDAMHFFKSGIEAIVEDEVTQRFTSSELSSWNLMTRTNTHYQHISFRLTLLWIVGGVLRYCLLLPVRLCILSFGLLLLTTTTAFVGYIPNQWAGQL